MILFQPHPGATQPAINQNYGMRGQLPMQQQQQLVQQQILKQLQQVVQQGHINPQILNAAQLTPNMVVMVQQLLQLDVCIILCKTLMFLLHLLEKEMRMLLLFHNR